jgi:hypothetical protein
MQKDNIKIVKSFLVCVVVVIFEDNDLASDGADAGITRSLVTFPRDLLPILIVLRETDPVVQQHRRSFIRVNEPGNCPKY